MNPSSFHDPGRPFHILTKPVGPICNLDCKYCFYLEKENLYPGETQWRMDDAVLEQYVSQYIRGQPGDEVQRVEHERMANIYMCRTSIAQPACCA